MNQSFYSYEEDLNTIPMYFRYRTSDGVVRKEEGNLVTYPDGSQGMVVAGVYWYTGPDEMLHAVKYEADANGYRAKSSTTKDINDILDFINFEPRIGIHVLISLVGSNG